MIFSVLYRFFVWKHLFFGINDGTCLRKSRIFGLFAIVHKKFGFGGVRVSNEKKNNNADISQGTIWVLGLGVIILPAILIFFGLKTSNASGLFWAAGAIAVVRILVCLPNLIGWAKGKKRMKMIKEGKLVEEQKKSYHPGRKFDDDE